MAEIRVEPYEGALGELAALTRKHGRNRLIAEVLGLDGATFEIVCEEWASVRGVPAEAIGSAVLIGVLMERGRAGGG